MSFNISNMPQVDLTNNSNTNTKSNQNNQPSFGTKLGYAAAFLTTVADFLAFVAAGIVIDEGISDAQQDEQDKKAQDDQMTKMQNQIEQLQKEIALLKKARKGQ